MDTIRDDKKRTPEQETVLVQNIQRAFCVCKDCGAKHVRKGGIV